ncbi:MAG: hypothetical protein HY018_10070 [Hydrogenophilales bacterium]|nr:hypothetical protein [Hydrogenophilales bacterium]
MQETGGWKTHKLVRRQASFLPSINLENICNIDSDVVNIKDDLENPRVLGSIPRLATTSDGSRFSRAVFPCVPGAIVTDKVSANHPLGMF